MDSKQFKLISGLKPANTPIETDDDGNFIALKFELLKPQALFYDVTQYLSALQGENGFQFPVEFLMNGVALSGNATVAIEGNSPAAQNNTMYILPKVISNGNGFYNIQMPPNVFQMVGSYNFTFVITQGTSVYKSAPFILTVGADMVSLAGGINVKPYDSEFDAYRAQLKQEYTNLAQEGEQCKTLFDQYQTYADGVITNKLTDVPKLDQDNTFTGKNNFDNVNLKSLSLNGNDITNGLIKGTNYINGALINGVTYWYANLYQMQFANQTVAILAAVMNIPNNATFQNATESKPVSVAQFPKGTLSTVGQTSITLSGAQFKLNKSTDTLDFIGLVSTTWDNWGRAIRDTAVII